MDHFTKEFCKKAFVRFPEWESVAVPVNYTNSDAYYLSFEFQSPGPSGEKMELITVDDEVTVEFAFYHIHLSDIQKALDFVEALQTEAIVVVKMEGERGEKCTYLEVETFMESDKEAFKSVRSWKGTYDLG